MPLTELVPTLGLAWLAYFIAVVSPGPATLAIAGTAMAGDRRRAIALANGVLTGSFCWALLAGTGMAAVVTKLAYGLVVLKCLGGLYLLFLAWKSFRSAMRTEVLETAVSASASLATSYRRGLLIHLTNPKAIFAWVSLVSIGLPAGADPQVIAVFIAGALVIGFLTFNGLAVLFSSSLVVRGYRRARRGIEGVMAAFFAFAGFKLLTTRF